jgi:hypothetical protein
MARPQNPDKTCGHCKQPQRARKSGCPLDPKNRKKRGGKLAAPASRPAAAAATKPAANGDPRDSIRAVIAQRERELGLLREVLEVLGG